ncbi:MAG: hypothetical protein FWH07_03495 [Oscillospiraceae bacterium]|nr:hypothetical protein [Oscillospiraceae bacterium]
MINVTDLKEKITGLLTARNVGDYGYSSFPTPYYPVCVFYFGSQSAIHHERISKKLTHGWGGAANQIPFYVLESDGLKTLEGENRNMEEFGEDMTNLLSCSNIYANPSGISLYCILDTDSVNSCSSGNAGVDFGNWYFAVNRIKQMINTPLTTMLLIALNDEFNHQKKSVEIKQTLCGIYQSQNNTHLYDSVFVIGRRLRNGAYSGETDSDLYANIILLSNTIDGIDSSGGSESQNDRRDNLYKSSKPALSAAYACSAKPIGDIAIITLKTITAKLSEMLNDSRLNKADESRVAKILEVDKGRSELYERVFAKIEGHFPSNDYLYQLPGKPDLSKTFAEADNASYGCLSAFLESNHFSITENQVSILKDEIVSQLTKRVCEQLTAAGLYEGVDETVITAALDKAGVMLDALSYAECTAIDAVKVKLKSGVADAMKGIIRETFAHLSAKSKICMDSFFRIKKSVDMMPAIREIGSGLHLVEFYTDKANRFLNAENSAKIFNRVFSVHNKDEDVLDALFSAMESCFLSDKIYRSSYIDEMYERLGINDIHTATSQIIGELIENLDEKVRFYSATVFPNNRTFEAYFLNTLARSPIDENGLYERLKRRELPANTGRTFFNTQSNDTVESMWFYECRENDLLAEL